MRKQKKTRTENWRQSIP